jgi:hypothetical protein
LEEINHINPYLRSGLPSSVAVYPCKFAFPFQSSSVNVFMLRHNFIAEKPKTFTQTSVIVTISNIEKTQPIRVSALKVAITYGHAEFNFVISSSMPYDKN